jgi:catechol 2,3-dioxygenase-like lactoylglutathione lyase family enzyme
VTVTVRMIRWLGVSVDDPHEAGQFLSEVLGMRVCFEHPDTIELETAEGDRVQFFAPGHPYHDRAQRLLPLLEIDDAGAGREEIAAAGIAVGALESDSAWEWFDVFGPEGFVFALGSRR